MSELNRPNETAKRTERSPSDTFSDRGALFSGRTWRNSISKKSLFGFLVLTAIVLMVLYQYGALASSSSIYYAFVASKGASHDNLHDFISVPASADASFTQIFSWPSKCLPNASKLTSNKANYAAVLVKLASRSCCAPFANLELIGDSQDSQHTYWYPTRELKFTTGVRAACDSSTELFIAIKSKSSNIWRRSVLRQTYLAPDVCNTTDRSSEHSTLCDWALRHTKYGFFLSSPENRSALKDVRSEAKQYGDVVLVSLVESYRNLTLKTGSSLFWTQTHCAQAKYVVSTDDDMLLNLTNVWRAILAMERNSSGLLDLNRRVRKSLTGGTRKYLRGLLSGKLARDETVRREGKWEIATSAYAQPIYPDFLKGWFAILSADVAQKIVRAIMCIRLLWLDDVFLFGILPEALGIRRTEFPGLTSYWERPLNFIDQLCDNSVGVMLLTEAEATTLWKACRSS